MATYKDTQDMNSIRLAKRDLRRSMRVVLAQISKESINEQSTMRSGTEG